MFHKARTTSLDLNAASSLLLDMLDISTAVTNNLSTKVEPRKWLERDGNLFLWPFALKLSISKTYVGV